MQDFIRIRPRHIYLIELHSVDAVLGASVTAFYSFTNGRRAKSYVKAQNRIARSENRADTYFVRRIPVGR